MSCENIDINMEDKEALSLLKFLESKNNDLVGDSKSVHSLSKISRKNSDDSQNSLNVLQLEPDQENLKQWFEIIENPDIFFKKKSQLKSLISEGIPTHFRPIVWQLLVGAIDSPLKDNYPKYMQRTSSHHKQIIRDIARTFPSHPMFKTKDGPGQQSLYRVINAYALYDPEIGYCQGFAFIVGILLMILPEEETFVVIVNMMEQHRLRELFKPKMYDIGLRLFQFENLVQKYVSSRLAHHFEAHGFYANIYASSWFLTFFTTTFSIDICFRIMDLILLEGIEVVFRFGLTYLNLINDEMIELDMDSMLNYIQNVAPQKINEFPEPLFQQSKSIKINATFLKKLEKDYSTIKTNELQTEIELRRLRTENGILLQRITYLETEITDLTKRLIDSSTQLASEDFYSSNLRCQLMNLQRQNDINNGDSSIHFEALKPLNNGCNDVGVVTDNELDSSQSSVDLSYMRSLENELKSYKLRDKKYSDYVDELQKSVEELNAYFIQQRAQSNLTNGTESKPSKSLFESAFRSLSLTNSNNSQQSHFQNNNSNQLQQQEIEITQLKLKNASLLSELSQVNQSTVELERQLSLNKRQLSQQDEKIQQHLDQLEFHISKEKDLLAETCQLKLEIQDLQNKLTEQNIESRLCESELRNEVDQLTLKMSRLQNSSTKCDQVAVEREKVSKIWKDIPPHLMTESIGPIEALCFCPDDPLITSIYLNPNPDQKDSDSGQSTPHRAPSPTSEQQ